jgi:hypothetical protein
VGTLFEWHIGINETGARNASGELLSPEVYAAGADTLPTRVRAVPADPQASWTLDQVADWLLGLIESDTRFLVGVNHRFSFPASYFEQQGVRSWQELLANREALTDEGEGPFVEAARFNDGLPGPERGWRMTERWGNSLTCMFQFAVRGLNDSSHSALPWLRRIREQAGSRLHVWPFDGWIPPDDRSVIAEVHPLQPPNCYPQKGRGPAEQNAYAISRWLLEADELGILTGYLLPQLPERICRAAAVEGWILGVH